MLNISIDLAVRGQTGCRRQPPPIEAFFRVIDQPILRLVSVDLGAVAEITTLGRGLRLCQGLPGPAQGGGDRRGHRAAGRRRRRASRWRDLLARLIAPGYGIEMVSQVNGIPKGSRLAVSTNLLASLIAVCMRATGQTQALDRRSLSEAERRVVAARAILGEWLGGSGGGWQDSGGVWPGMKLIQGVEAGPDDPEVGHQPWPLAAQPHDLERRRTCRLRRASCCRRAWCWCTAAWRRTWGRFWRWSPKSTCCAPRPNGRGGWKAIRLFDEITGASAGGDIRAIGAATERNFRGPDPDDHPLGVQPLHRNADRPGAQPSLATDFWGFWMLGGMAGGGMGFIFDPAAQGGGAGAAAGDHAGDQAGTGSAVPFAMEPVVYDFAINERGTWAELRTGEQALMPAGYYTLTLPGLLRHEQRSALALPPGRAGCLWRGLPHRAGAGGHGADPLRPAAAAQRQPGSRGQQSLAALLEQNGFDRVQHEQIRADLRSGRIGLAQNRLPVRSQDRRRRADDVVDMAEPGRPERDRAYVRWAWTRWPTGAVAVVSLAGGAGSRWTKGAGVVKALNPFARLGGKHRNFVEVHLAKSRRIGQLAGNPLPHIITTSYLTHDAMAERWRSAGNYGYPGPAVALARPQRRAAPDPDGARSALCLGGDAPAAAGRAGAEGAPRACTPR